MSRIEPAFKGSRSYPHRFDTELENQIQTGCFGLTNEQPTGSAVIISTRGRANIVSSLVKQLALQSLPPEHIFVVATCDEDVAELDRTQKNLTVTIGRPGSTFQRNDGLRLAGARFSYIVFFDDDFVPSRFWIERMSQIFESRPDIAGMTGDMLADGTRTAGIDLAFAKTQVQGVDSNLDYSRVIEEDFAYGSNVGCNMAYRYSTMHDITFDERLPLYAWHEDSDFRGQVTRRGKFVRARSLYGVHLGHKKGRGSGVTLGYSQIANALYLARKGTVPAGFLAGIACKNIIINTLRSIRPEPFVDRRGRMRGNFIALLDLIRGRLAPERILNLQ